MNLAGQQIGTQENPPLLLYSLHIDSVHSQEIHKINVEYLAIARKLQTAGAQAIAICANTPQLVYDCVQPKFTSLFFIVLMQQEKAKKIRSVR